MELTRRKSRRRSLTHKDILKLFSKSRDRKLDAESKNQRQDEELQERYRKIDKMQKASVRLMDMEVIKLQDRLRKTTLSKSLQNFPQAEKVNTPSLKRSRKISISHPNISQPGKNYQRTSRTLSTDSNGDDMETSTMTVPHLPKIDPISSPRLRKHGVTEIKRLSLDSDETLNSNYVKLPLVLDQEEKYDSKTPDDSQQIEREPTSQKTRPHTALSILQQTVIARGIFLKLLREAKSEDGHLDEESDNDNINSMFLTGRRRSLSDL